MSIFSIKHAKDESGTNCIVRIDLGSKYVILGLKSYIQGLENISKKIGEAFTKDDISKYANDYLYKTMVYAKKYRVTSGKSKILYNNLTHTEFLIKQQEEFSKHYKKEGYLGTQKTPSIPKWISETAQVEFNQYLQKDKTKKLTKIEKALWEFKTTLTGDPIIMFEYRHGVKYSRVKTSTIRKENHYTEGDIILADNFDVDGLETLYRKGKKTFTEIFKK